MARTDYSKELKRAARKDGLSVQEKAFADLVVMGWDYADAYLASGMYNPLYKLDVNMMELQKLKETQRFAGYYNSRVEEHRKKSEEFLQGGGNADAGTEKVDFRSKDSIIDQLGKAATSLSGKDRADVLMKIADLQQMKKDENKDEEERVHFYLPANCPHSCKLFK